jgi:hypothetical protein
MVDHKPASTFWELIIGVGDITDSVDADGTLSPCGSHSFGVPGLWHSLLKKLASNSELVL